MPIFNQAPLLDLSWEDAFIGFVFILNIIIIALVRKHRQAQEQSRYAPRLAWLQGGVYFCSCFILSWGFGVFKTLTRTPWFLQENLRDPRWLTATGIFLTIIIVGYYVIWPRGTRTMGRKLDIMAILLFGLLWGLSEGQLFLVIFAMVERFELTTLQTGILAFTLIAMYQGLWHSLFWDIQVAPEHNIPSWNLPKIAFVHVPNLGFGIYYLLAFSSPAIFLIMQTIGIIGGTYFMRFPRWSDN